MHYHRSEPLKSDTALGHVNTRRIIGFLLPYRRRLSLIFLTVGVAAGLGVSK